MNDDQRFFRFIIPGFASLTVTGLAFAITFPRVLCYVTQLELGGWITAIIGSGGLGFLLSQTYFAFRCSLLDYRKYFTTHAFVEHLRPMLHGEDHGYAKDLWNQARDDRQVAYNLGTFLWQKLIADCEKALNNTTSRAASRMAAVGATWIGVALGLLSWLVVVFGFEPCCVSACRALASAFVFVLALGVLGVVHYRLQELNQVLVRLGLATWTPQRYLCGRHRIGNRSDQR